MGGVYLTDSRLHGELDDRSLIDITMELLIKAKQVEKLENKKYQYFALLSGQDYLIKPITWIEGELERSYPEPFIDCTPYDRENWLYYKFKKNHKVIAFNRWISNSLKKGVIRSGFRICAMVFEAMLPIVKKTAYHSLKREKIELYGGSAWWILPDIVIDYVISEISRKKSYIDTILNEVNTPEEVFFQIMAMRSSLKSMVKVNPSNQREQNCKTWAYFSDKGKPFRGHPYIFTEGEFEKIRENECWIARKFDLLEDSKIFDMIDDYILYK